MSKFKIYKRFSLFQRNISSLFATGFGIGKLFLPISGTIGSILSLPLCIYLSSLSWTKYLLIIFIVMIVSIICCKQAERKFMNHDCKSIILDEFVGILISFFPLSLSMYIYNKKYICINLIMFRIFDIIKPWPIFLIDKRISGGIGIVLDDVVAGIFSALFSIFFL